MFIYLFFLKHISICICCSGRRVFPALGKFTVYLLRPTNKSKFSRLVGCGVGRFKLIPCLFSQKWVPGSPGSRSAPSCSLARGSSSFLALGLCGRRVSLLLSLLAPETLPRHRGTSLSLAQGSAPPSLRAPASPCTVISPPLAVTGGTLVTGRPQPITPGAVCFLCTPRLGPCVCD